jgi:hypothetical protein
LLDTENGRGCFYADSPGIIAALPNGFEIMDLVAPFSPARYIEAIDAAERAGINVLVIDSGSHEWEGTGGCSEIAANDKGRWNNAKLANRRYVYRLLYSTMYIIVCLRAREKSKIIPKSESKTGKEEVLSLGIQPIAEKNFIFEMLLSLQLDEQTHFAMPLKVPEPLSGLFKGDRMITKEDGERIREWNQTGAAGDPVENLKKRALESANEGVASYAKFFQSITPQQRKLLAGPAHEANKKIAEAADRAVPTFGSAENPVEWPEAFDGPVCIFNGDRYEYSEESSGYRKVDIPAAADKAA